MRFNPKARLDTSRTHDVGGSAGGGLGGGGLGGGGGFPLPAGRLSGGGLVLLLVVVLIGQCTGVGPDLGSVLGGATASTLDASRFSPADGDTQRYAACKSGDDANNNPDCALVAVENSLYGYWGDELGSRFQPEAGVVTFTGSVKTGCGDATTDVGPFYCPTDQTIYLDTAFYRDMLEGQLGGKDAPFVRAYVIAHEYGHHIQNLLGIMGQVRTQQGPKSDSVKLELQADCFAGMWAQAAQTTPDEDGQVLISDLSESDITDAIGAATAVGDDYIEKRMSGGVNPEKWTHGSSAQRVQWFKTGMASNNNLDACDTFKAGAI